MSDPIFRVTNRSGDDGKPVLQQLGTGRSCDLFPLRFVWVWATSLASARRIQQLYRQGG